MPQKNDYGWMDYLTSPEPYTGHAPSDYWDIESAFEKLRKTSAGDLAEAGKSMLSSAIRLPGIGLASLPIMAMDGPDAAYDFLQHESQRGYKPTKGGAQVLQDIAESPWIDTAEQVHEKAAEGWGEMGSLHSPQLGAGLYAGVKAGPAAVGGRYAQKAGRKASELLDVATDTSGINRPGMGRRQGGVISKKFTPEERAIAKKEGLTVNDFEVNGIQYSEVIDPKAAVVAGSSMGDVYKHDIQKVRPELAETAAAFQLSMPEGEASYTPRKNLIEMPIANLDKSTQSAEGMDELVNLAAHEATHAATTGEGMPVGGSPDFGGPERKQALQDKMWRDKTAKQNSPEYKEHRAKLYESEMAKQPASQPPMVSNIKAQQSAEKLSQEHFFGDFNTKKQELADLSDFNTYQRLQDEFMARTGAQREVDARMLSREGMDEASVQKAMSETPLEDPEGYSSPNLIQIFDKYGLNTPMASAKNPYKKGSKEWTDAEGLRHKVGLGKVTKKPFDEMTRTVQNDPNASPKKYTSLEEMQGGTVIAGQGDLSEAGKILTHVGGTELTDPINLRGGHRFPAGREIWAGDEGAISGLNTRAEQILDAGGRPILGYQSMADKASNFNTFTVDAAYDLIHQKVGKEAKKTFDKAMRSGKGARKEWPGLDHPDAKAMLDSSGELRHRFMQIAGTDEHTNRNFPDLAEVRKATTDPELMNTPYGMYGRQFSEMTGRTVDSPDPHPTYRTTMEGTELGDAEVDVPWNIMFRDFMGERHGGDKDAPIGQGDYRSFSLSNAAQLMDQEWLDNVMKYTQQTGQEDPTGVRRLLGEAENIGRRYQSQPARVAESTEQFGGYTVNPRTGEVPTEGHIVSMLENTDPRVTVLPPGEKLTAQHVRDFYAKNKDMLQEEGLMGTWRDDVQPLRSIMGGRPGERVPTGSTFLDISKQFKDLEEAKRFGEAKSQLEGMTIKGGEPFGGSGWKTSDFGTFPIKDLTPDELERIMRLMENKQ